jgi:two-component system, NtrC family, sensor histidine kinase HydH
MAANGDSMKRAGSQLTRQFGLLGLAVIAVITLALAVALSLSLRRDLLDGEWAVTADFIRTEATNHLLAADFVERPAPLSETRFRDFNKEAVSLPEIVGVNVYDASMTVIWSEDRRLVGQRYPDRAELRRAVGGSTAVALPAAAEPERRTERGQGTPLAALYVPVAFPGTDQAVGVVETYKAPTRVFAQIRRAWMTVLAMALAGGGALYGCLLWVVRRAARRIDDQQRALLAASEQLRSTQSQLVQAERMAAIGEVVAAVAHGIRNPLANIRATAELEMLQCQGCEFSKKNSAAIIGEVDRMSVRLRDLLQFVGPGERPRQQVDLNGVIQEAARALTARLAQTLITLTTHLAPDLPPISGNPSLLEQVFAGLIGNAIEASSSAQGNSIMIVTGTERPSPAARTVYVEIADTGVGISPESLANIFEPFYTTKAQGIGLGLALAKKFTEVYGGSITVQSRPHEGTKFRATFPVDEPTSGGA